MKADSQAVRCEAGKILDRIVSALRSRQVNMIRTGLWKTEGGSVLNLIVEDERVSGTYTTIHGQPRPDEAVPIIGFVNDDLIAFVASWGKHRSMTSWSGRFCIDHDRECIRTSWTLVRKFADREHRQENELWESFITFSGTYYLMR